MEAGDVLAVLRGLRIQPGLPEMALHACIAEGLRGAGFPLVHEARLGPRCRIDFLVDDVGIEIKCGKPPRRTLLAQLARYAAGSQIHSLIVVVERSAHLPTIIGGKPCHVLSLNRLWGIALPT